MAVVHLVKEDINVQVVIFFIVKCEEYLGLNNSLVCLHGFYRYIDKDSGGTEANCISTLVVLYSVCVSLHKPVCSFAWTCHTTRLCYIWVEF